MVAGNVIGQANQPVTALQIVQKFKELFHDKVVAEIEWSGEDSPSVIADEKVAISLGGKAQFTKTAIVNLGPRTSVSFIAVGGGGGGGHGRENGYGPAGDRKGGDGTATRFEFRLGSSTGTLINSYNLAGGAGGSSGSVSYSGNERRGGLHIRRGTGDNVVSRDPEYGQIGTGGIPRESSSGTNATGFGAGGGGGGGDLPSFFDSSGAGGFKGRAGTFKEETLDTSGYGEQNIFLVITQVGVGGKGGVGGGNNGGRGAPGVIILKEQFPSNLPAAGPTFDESALLDSILGEDHLGLGRKIDGDKIYEVFLAKANEYTQIRKLRIIGTEQDGTPYDRTEVAYLNATFRSNIDTSSTAIVNSENELDPGDLNEDEDIVTYFNNLYNGWKTIRDTVIVNGDTSFTTGDLPTFNSSDGTFSVPVQSREFIESSKTFKPTKTETLAFVVIGGGGGDGGNHISTGASGAGGGGIAIKILRVSVGQTYNITVGSGGIGDASGGNSSVIGGGLTLIGGGGGPATDSHGTGVAASNGGNASGGDYNFEGGNGATFTNAPTSGGPAGGNTPGAGAVDITLSRFNSSPDINRQATMFVASKIITGAGGAPGNNGRNFGGGAGARTSSSTVKAGSKGCVAIIRF